MQLSLYIIKKKNLKVLLQAKKNSKVSYHFISYIQSRLLLINSHQWTFQRSYFQENIILLWTRLEFSFPPFSPSFKLYVSIVVTRKFFRQSLRATSVPRLYLPVAQSSIAAKKPFPTPLSLLCLFPCSSARRFALNPARISSVPSRLQAGIPRVPCLVYFRRRRFLSVRGTAQIRGGKQCLKPFHGSRSREPARWARARESHVFARGEGTTHSS